MPNIEILILGNVREVYLCMNLGIPEKSDKVYKYDVKCHIE